MNWYCLRFGKTGIKAYEAIICTAKAKEGPEETWTWYITHLLAASCCNHYTICCASSNSQAQAKLPKLTLSQIWNPICLVYKQQHSTNIGSRSRANQPMFQADQAWITHHIPQNLSTDQLPSSGKLCKPRPCPNPGISLCNSPLGNLPVALGWWKLEVKRGAAVVLNIWLSLQDDNASALPSWRSESLTSAEWVLVASCTHSSLVKGMYRSKPARRSLEFASVCQEPSWSCPLWVSAEFCQIAGRCCGNSPWFVPYNALSKASIALLLRGGESKGWGMLMGMLSPGRAFKPPPWACKHNKVIWCISSPAQYAEICTLCSATSIKLCTCSVTCLQGFSHQLAAKAAPIAWICCSIA